jgi:hypothetical protein
LVCNSEIFLRLAVQDLVVGAELGLELSPEPVALGVERGLVPRRREAGPGGILRVERTFVTGRPDLERGLQLTRNGEFLGVGVVEELATLINPKR